MVRPAEACLQIQFAIGQIKSVTPFPRARNPSYKVQVDFGPVLQTLQTSAQLPLTYPDPTVLLQRWVLGVVNFPRKNIANFMSEFLLVGFPNQHKQVHLVNLLRDSPSHLTLGGTLCGWQDQSAQQLKSGSLSWAQFESSEIRCGRILSVGPEPHTLQLSISEKEDAESITAALPLPLAPTMTTDLLLNTLVIYTPSATPGTFLVLAYPSSDGLSCFPLGIDQDSQVILHSHLY